MVATVLVALLLARVTHSAQLVLTSENFTEVVEVEGSKMLVQFFAPWCSYCKRLAPKWQTAAQMVEEATAEDPEGLVAQMAVVDAVDQLELARRFRVKSYPTLYWFVDGEAAEYRGGLSAHDIADWVISRGGQHVRRLRNASVVDTFKLTNAVTLVAELSDATLAANDGLVLRALRAAARQFGPPCGLATAAKGSERIVLTRALDEAAIVYGGDFHDSEALRRFVGSASSIPTSSSHFPAEAPPGCMVWCLQTAMARTVGVCLWMTELRV